MQLIEIAINLVKKLRLELGIRYLVLSPDNNDLNKDWMYFKVN